MANSSLKARIARLGPVRAVDRVASGSPANLVLSAATERAGLKTVAAALELARHGIPLLKAKRVLEEMIARGRAYVRLPMVEDTAALLRTLRALGIHAAVADPPTRVDVKAIRERTGLTQEQFALRFRIDLDALRNWESQRREPDPMARCMLHVIDYDPAHAEDALAAAGG
jgi:DNA-binding transcriptional regulator YiaG